MKVKTNTWGEDWGQYKEALAAAAFEQVQEDLREGEWHAVLGLLNAVPALDLSNYIAEEKRDEIEAIWAERLVG